MVMLLVVANVSLIVKVFKRMPVESVVVATEFVVVAVIVVAVVVVVIVVVVVAAGVVDEHGDDGQEDDEEDEEDAVHESKARGSGEGGDEELAHLQVVPDELPKSGSKALCIKLAQLKVKKGSRALCIKLAQHKVKG